MMPSSAESLHLILAPRSLQKEFLTGPQGEGSLLVHLCCCKCAFWVPLLPEPGRTGTNPVVALVLAGTSVCHDVKAACSRRDSEGHSSRIMSRVLFNICCHWAPLALAPSSLQTPVRPFYKLIMS